jgi:excinuclease ABC subunit C
MHQLLDETTLNTLPDSSGIYIFRDKEGNIVYIGKAKSLKDRVKSYFSKTIKDTKTARLVATVATVETVLTANEKEAFLLETNLIKEHTPKYNINLKDDKTYVSIKLTVKDRYPAVFVTRKIENDGAVYFGPYPHAKDVRDVMKLIQELYPVRRCKDTVFRKRKRPCMLSELGKCLAPCAFEDNALNPPIPPLEKGGEGGFSKEEQYKAVVDELTDFLSGKDEKLLKDLERRIKEASAKWHFEEAKQLKERFLAIKGMMEKQHVHQHLGKNRDVWAFLEGQRGMSMALLAFRRGVLLSKKLFKESLMKIGYDEAISSFLYQYYSSRPIPDEVILSEEIADMDFLELFLKERKNGEVKILGPGTKAARETVGLAIENLHEPEQIAIEAAFRRALNLKKEPERIEIYDISHTHGSNPTGVMVVYENFKVNKNGYRVFHIQTAPAGDDVAAIAEVLGRRIRNEKLGPLPDLFIIDGGKGQLSATTRVLKSQNVDKDAIGIAKGERRRGMEDLIYLPNRKNPLKLPKASPVFREIVKMRDEAHRFAVSSHRRWKKNEDLKPGP